MAGTIASVVVLVIFAVFGLGAVFTAAAVRLVKVYNEFTYFVRENSRF